MGASDYALSLGGMALPFFAPPSFLNPTEIVNQSKPQLDALAGQSVRRQDYEDQKEFAKHGIRWRVEDAKAAGLHPLAALGAVGASFTPSGQDISRSMYSTATQSERMAGLLQLEGLVLDNQLKVEQIRSIASQSGPGLPSNSNMPLLTGQGNAYVHEGPLTRVHSSPGRPDQEVGAVADWGAARTREGYAVVPSKDVKEKIEDQIVPEVMWAIRNYVFPAIGLAPYPELDHRKYPVPEGYDSWLYKPWLGEFRPIKSNVRKRR